MTDERARGDRVFAVYRTVPATIESAEYRLYLCYDGREPDRTVIGAGGRPRKVKGAARRAFKRGGKIALVDEATAEDYRRRGCGVIHERGLSSKRRRG